MKYLVNVDWVELYCKFDSLLCRNEFATPHDSDLHGFGVILREYGTRVYANVASITYNREPFAVLTFNPLSSLDRGGIMSPLMCHIKLENEWCYRDGWWDTLKHALRVFRINPLRISRVDICCDVQHFACGLYAADLCQGLIKRRYYKVHQPNWSAHGKDSARIIWNSLAFGSTSSPVFTRFYNKTLELCQKKDKQYIRECWKLVGFNEDRDVWRVEFSLHDTGREVIDTETGEQFDITPEQIADRTTLEGLFLRYASHYWDIRKNTGDSRYKCRPLQMFPPTPQLFRPVQRPHLGTMGRTDKQVLKALFEVGTALPNRKEKLLMLKAIKLYQQSKRVEYCTDWEMEQWKKWAVFAISDDDNEKTAKKAMNYEAWLRELEREL